MKNYSFDSIAGLTRLPMRIISKLNESGVVIELKTPMGEIIIETVKKDVMEETHGFLSSSKKYEMRDKTIHEIMYEITDMENDAKNYLLNRWLDERA